MDRSATLAVWIRPFDHFKKNRYEMLYIRKKVQQQKKSCHFVCSLKHAPIGFYSRPKAISWRTVNRTN